MIFFLKSPGLVSWYMWKNVYYWHNRIILPPPPGVILTDAWHSKHTNAYFSYSASFECWIHELNFFINSVFLNDNYLWPNLYNHHWRHEFSLLFSVFLLNGSNLGSNLYNLHLIHSGTSSSSISSSFDVIIYIIVVYLGPTR